jgi:hypothetical protein
VDEAIKYVDDILLSSYHGIGTSSQELTDSPMKDMIGVHTLLSQFRPNMDARKKLGVSDGLWSMVTFN